MQKCAILWTECGVGAVVEGEVISVAQLHLR